MIDDGDIENVEEEAHTEELDMLLVNDKPLVVMRDRLSGDYMIVGADGKRYAQVEQTFYKRRGIELRCKNCSHEWTYKGSGHNATCPNCQRNNNLKDHPVWKQRHSQ